MKITNRASPHDICKPLYSNLPVILTVTDPNVGPSSVAITNSPIILSAVLLLSYVHFKVLSTFCSINVGSLGQVRVWTRIYFDLNVKPQTQL